MAHNLFSRDTMVSGRKMSVWHQSQTGDKTLVVDGLMTGRRGADLGWRRQDGQPGHWNPLLVPCFARAGGDDYIAIPNSFHVVRDDMPIDSPDRFISAGRGVGKGFTPITNTEIADYMDALMNAGAAVDTAGSLFNGARVWMSAYLPEVIDVEGDAVAQFMLLTTAHDGTAALELMLTPTRVVCWNTLSMARRSEQKITVPHRKNAAARLSQANEIIERAAKSFGSVADILRRLALCSLTDKQISNLTEKLIVGERTDAVGKRNKIIDLYHGAQIGSDSGAVKGTAYGWLSAVTEWIETDKPTRKAKEGDARSDDERRMNSVIWGSGARLRDKAMSLAANAAKIKL